MVKPFIGFLLTLITLNLQAQSSNAYQQGVLAHRVKQDSTFKFDEHSPLSPAEKKNFKALAYFPIDEAYRVKTKFVRTPQENIYKMPATGNIAQAYVKYGELLFRLRGQELRLNVYQNQDLLKQAKYKDYLFIPFTDATTGQETYATGRYLEFSIPASTDSVWLDFNMAYNPYCAYSAGYSCPIPPKENKLPVRVEAGEKTYEKQAKTNGTAALSVEESMPEYPGGMAAMFKFLTNHFVMPTLARKAGITGVVEVQFVVKADGTVGDFQVVKSLRPDVDVAVVYAFGQMPLWKPGMQGGKPVNVKYKVPFRVNVR